VTLRPGAALIGTAIAAVSLCGEAAAQFSVAQPAAYLLTTDGFDARSVWIQPAGLSRRREASLGFHATGDRAAGKSSVVDYGITVASNGLAFGWQRDRRSDGPDASVYAIGVGLGDARFAAGFTRRWHRSQGVAVGTFDIGARYQPGPLMDLSVVWRDISEPVIRDTVHRAVLVPAAAFNLLRGRLRVGGEVDLLSDGWGTSEVRGGATLVLAPTLLLRMRGTFAPGLERRELALAAEWTGRTSRIAGFTQDRRGGDVLRAGLSGTIVAEPPRRRIGRR
jgi:hypothetical protein